jgi:hypothetical protein
VGCELRGWVGLQNLITVLGILDTYKGDYRLRVFIERDKNDYLLQYRYLTSKKKYIENM